MWQIGTTRRLYSAVQAADQRFQAGQIGNLVKSRMIDRGVGVFQIPDQIVGHMYAHPASRKSPIPQLAAHSPPPRTAYCAPPRVVASLRRAMACGVPTALC